MRDIFDFIHLAGSSDVNIMTGTNGADTMEGTAGADRINGGLGNDLLSDAAGGDDVLVGGAGDDIISVTRTDIASTDKIRIFGGVGADTISYTGVDGAGTELRIDGGSGENVFDVEHANDATIYGGNAVDTVTVSADGYALVHTAAGDDVVAASADTAEARVAISTGVGNDSVTLDSDNDGHYRLRLGEGQDTVHQNASTDDSAVKLVFWDFQSGASGDSLELLDYLNSVTTHHDKHVDYFSDGHLRLTDGTTPDGRAAAVLEIDADGTKNGENWVKLAIFVGVAADDLTSDNLVGLTPEVTHLSDPFAI
jgi:hypothetical protein